ncbi:GTP-binding protein [Vibrio sp. Isolate23]|uniref:CobW family GTP-binding protein n=1 Tax=Vibrio TaxID=662 RepID=UPI001EFD1A24|nr:MULTISPECIES: GTP-binding protein [Vibrio]MCG9677289.1 GTP-binding protein [Vibrio sp. Isolate24]MCG9681035.1 GTP-binding protein [Vibrio sp. Isolate23]USD35409.1 GTP-binding protein [Vibrio sp. SCSIO 43186]USD48477.1 GTP-binding protein [Vibrio sp. SCSIO 43145]USD72533.1 GTP-binding protein [Vibrio sp. SCSIO 43139]
MKIPTNIITGFLGTGKTTAILNLLKEKPADENWAVLVNEFGEIGIDGAMLTEQGAMIKEVPGGCMCCAAGVPTSVAITALLRTQPDRLIVEPTGLGHAHKILATLTSVQFRDYIDLRATIGLVDPRNLSRPKYLENQNFIDQLSIADIVIGNKVDECHVSDVDAFNDWVADQNPPKIYSQLVKQGRFPIELLDNPRRNPTTSDNIEAHHHQHAEAEPQFALAPDQTMMRKENKGQGYFSCGWLFGAEVTFDFDELFSMLSDLTAERVKGVMNTDKGCYSFNVSNGVVSVNQMSLEGFESRLEVIDTELLPWDQLETVLKHIAKLG